MRFVPQRLQSLYKWTAFRISLIYFAIGALWILYSDYLLYAFTSNPHTEFIVAIVKGWFYVTATAAMLYALIQRNIGKIERVEQERAESEISYRELSESITEIFFGLDEDAVVTYWNRAAQQFTGISASEALGRPVHKVFPFLQEADKQGFLAETLQSTRKATIERRGIYNGKEYYFEINAYPSQSGLSVFARDITQQKEYESELKIALSQMQVIQESIVNVVSSITEKRDPYIAGHQERTSGLAAEIAREMKLSESQVEGIRIAALLHDVGKIFIPSEILSKPGPLSRYEKDIVRIYPRVSYEVLKSIPFPWPVADIALEHQERMNGSGYPAGLLKDNITIGAKIIAVADSIDAATSHRPYRPAKSLEEVLKEVKENAGTLYDTDVVDACERVLRRKAVGV